MLAQLNQKISQIINLESALMGQGRRQYVWYRSRFFLLSTLLYYASYYLRLYFLGDDYTQFYLSQMALYEQAIFWVGQFIWLFILSADNPKENGLAQPSLIHPRAFLYLGLGFSGLMALLLFLNGLLVFTRWSIYGCISAIFIVQTAINIYIKSIHAKVYTHQRVFVYLPFIILVNVLTAGLQIILWRPYMYWSIPLTFGLQYFLLTLVRSYYYFKAYRQIPHKGLNTENVGQTFSLLFGKHALFALFLLSLEIFYFVLIKFYFYPHAHYEIFIFFIAALMSSRYPFIYFQDFIKYNQKKYDALTFNYFKFLLKYTAPITFGIFTAFISTHYFLNGYIPIKLTLEMLFLGLTFSLHNLLMIYLFSRRLLKIIFWTSLGAILLVTLNLYLFQQKYFYPSILVLVILGGVYAGLIKKMHSFLIRRIYRVSYDINTFKYSLAKSHKTRLISVHLNQVTYNHKVLTDFINHAVSNETLVYLASKSHFYLAFNSLEINPEVLFYISNMDEISVAKYMKDFNEKDYLKANLDFKVETPIELKAFTFSDLKLLFNKAFKQHRINPLSKTDLLVRGDFHNGVAHSLTITPRS